MAKKEVEQKAKTPAYLVMIDVEEENGIAERSRLSMSFSRSFGAERQAAILQLLYRRGKLREKKNKSIKEELRSLGSGKLARQRLRAQQVL